MKNKVITAFLIVVLGANLVGNIYQYIRMENATKEVAVLTEQRNSLKERGESKEQQRDEQLSQLEDLQSQLEDLQTTLSELEKEKATKSEILAQKQAEEKVNEETEDEPETEAKEQTGKSSNKTMSDTSSQSTGTTDNNMPPEDLTGGDTDGDGFMSEEEAAAIDWGDWGDDFDFGEPGEYNPNVTIFAP